MPHKKIVYSIDIPKVDFTSFKEDSPEERYFLSLHDCHRDNTTNSCDDFDICYRRTDFVSISEIISAYLYIQIFYL